MIGGTTASGKSALALQLARRTGGIVINADSQQLFRDLPTLTARPGPAELAAAPHRLYGLLGPEEQPSAGRWLDLVLDLLRRATPEGAPLILVGGTGFYLHALLHGLSPAPRVPRELRARLDEEWAVRPTSELHAALAARDPAMADRLRPSDRQRLLRALEVLEATGRSLLEWQSAPRERLAFRLPPHGVALVPSAVTVARRIAARLDAMLAEGALEEVAALAERLPELDRLPVVKVHGCRDLLAYLQGRQDLTLTRERIAAQIRQYAKRQRTFLRHQLTELQIHEGPGEALPHALVAGLMRALDV